jgi:hypothetical protein
MTTDNFTMEYLAYPKVMGTLRAAGAGDAVWWNKSEGGTGNACMKPPHCYLWKGKTCSKPFTLRLRFFSGSRFHLPFQVLFISSKWRV